MELVEDKPKIFEYKDGISVSVSSNEKRKTKWVTIKHLGRTIGRFHMMYIKNIDEYYLMDFKIIPKYQKLGGWGSNLIEVANKILDYEGVVATLRNGIKGPKRSLYSSHGWIEDRMFPGKFVYKPKVIK